RGGAGLTGPLVEVWSRENRVHGSHRRRGESDRGGHGRACGRGEGDQASQRFHRFSNWCAHVLGRAEMEHLRCGGGINQEGALCASTQWTRPICAVKTENTHCVRSAAQRRKSDIPLAAE